MNTALLLRKRASLGLILLLTQVRRDGLSLVQSCCDGLAAAAVMKAEDVVQDVNDKPAAAAHPAPFARGDADADAGSSNDGRRDPIPDAAMHKDQYGPRRRIPPPSVDPRPSTLLDVRRRALQGTDAASIASCPTEAATVRACLDAAVGYANTTQRDNCAECYFQKEYQALQEYGRNPTLNCKLLRDNVCTAVRMCPCLQKCDAQVSGLADCQLRDSFVDVGVNLTCPSLSCQATNSTLDDDEMGIGYCGGEELDVKNCVETATLAPFSDCMSCLRSAPGSTRITNATTCPELREAHCLRTESCPCIVPGCRASLVNMRNCNMKVLAITFPHLSDCVIDDAQCASTQSQAPAQGPATGSGSGPSETPPPAPSTSTSSPAQAPGGEGDASDTSAAPSLFSWRWHMVPTMILGAYFAAATASTSLS